MVLELIDTTAYNNIFRHSLFVAERVYPLDHKYIYIKYINNNNTY